MLGTDFHGRNRERLGMAWSDYTPFGAQLDAAMSATRGRTLPRREHWGRNIRGSTPRYSVTSFQYNPDAGLIVPRSLTYGRNVRILAARAAIAVGLRDGETALQYQNIATGTGLTEPLETDSAQEATVLARRRSYFQTLKSQTTHR